MVEGVPARGVVVLCCESISSANKVSSDLRASLPFSPRANHLYLLGQKIVVPPASPKIPLLLFGPIRVGSGPMLIMLKVVVKRQNLWV